MREIFVNNILINTDCFKDLGSFIGLDRTDSHFGSDFDNAMQNSVVVIINGCIIILVKHMAVDQLADGFLCKIRIDRTGTITKQGSKIMHIPWFS